MIVHDWDLVLRDKRKSNMIKNEEGKKNSFYKVELTPKNAIHCLT